MPKEQTHCIGIDGCKSGWFAVVAQGDTYTAARFDTLAEIVAPHPTATILIDMPIGLADAHTPRTIEKKMRKLLAPLRHSSVFTPACRKAVYLTNYAKANHTNRTEIGKGLSKQAFYLGRKIVEVDQLLRANPQFVGHIHEAHPEICFAGLNASKDKEGRPTLRPMSLPKAHRTRTNGCTTHSGIELRLHVLTKTLPIAKQLYKQWLQAHKRKDVARDDIVDALCLAHTAQLAMRHQRDFFWLQDANAQDTHNLPIKLAYINAATL